jgi:hypothetical protein
MSLITIIAIGFPIITTAILTYLAIKSAEKKQQRED